MCRLSPGPHAHNQLVGDGRGRERQARLKGVCCLLGKQRKQLETQVPAQMGGRQALSVPAQELSQADRSYRTAEQALTGEGKGDHSFLVTNSSNSRSCF